MSKGNISTSNKNDDVEEIPESGQDQIASKVSSAYQKAASAQQIQFALFKELYQLWRFYKSRNSGVKVINPVAYALTIGLLSKFYTKAPKLSILARQDVDEIAKKLVKGLLEYQFDNPEKSEPMDEQFISFITELCVTGTAVAKVCWVTEFNSTYENVPKLDKKGEPVLDKNGFPEFDKKKINKKGFDDPVFEHIPIENFYIQPGATSIEKAEWVIYEKWVDKDHLEDMQEQGIYSNVDLVVYGSQNKTDKTGIAASRTPGGKGDSSERYKDKAHLLEYWTDDRVIVVINEKVVVRDDTNPFNHGKKPFVSMPYTRVPHEFYGIGAIEPARDLQKSVNISITQRLEYISNMLNQQYAVLNQRGVDEDAIIDGYPIVHMDSPDAVTPLNKMQIANSVFINSNDILSDIERAMGISGYELGNPNASSDKTRGTKGGVEAIIGEAQDKFAFLMKRFEQNVLKPTAQMFLDLDLQYLPSTEEKVIHIVEDDGTKNNYPVTRQILENVNWMVNIVPFSTGTIDKQNKLANFMAWVDFAMKSIPNFDKQAAVMEAAHIQEIDHPERFIKEMPPELPQQDVPSTSISFKDLPMTGKIQLAKKAGIEISAEDMLNQQALSQEADMNKAVHAARINKLTQVPPKVGAPSNTL